MKSYHPVLVFGLFFCMVICCGAEDTAHHDLDITAPAILAQLRDWVPYEVTVRNDGQAMVEDLTVSVSRWSDDVADIGFLLPGRKKTVRFDLFVEEAADDLMIVVAEKGKSIAAKQVFVTILIPEHALYIEVDERDTARVCIVDNRGKEERVIMVSYRINKGKIAYFQGQSNFLVPADKIMQNAELLPQLSLKGGDYEVHAEFFEGGEKVDSTVTRFSVEGRHAPDASIIFYMLIAAIIAGSVYVLFMGRGD